MTVVAAGGKLSMLNICHTQDDIAIWMEFSLKEELLHVGPKNARLCNFFFFSVENVQRLFYNLRS